MSLDSSLLYNGEDGRQHFVHDSWRDYFLAKWFETRGVDPTADEGMEQTLLFYVGSIRDASTFISTRVSGVKGPLTEHACFFLGELVLNSKYVDETAQRAVVEVLYHCVVNAGRRPPFAEADMNEQLSKVGAKATIEGLLRDIHSISEIRQVEAINRDLNYAYSDRLRNLCEGNFWTSLG